MLRRFIAKQSGQTLILVAVALIVLLGFLALAIDGGWLYSERRHMQNAADAGALAGAWEICFGTPGLASATATDYAERNTATADKITVTIDQGRVDVVAGRAVSTFFAKVLGFPTVDVYAKAAARCGKACSADGLWPIGFSSEYWKDLHCGDTFLLWDDSGDADCSIYDCNTLPPDCQALGAVSATPLDGRAWIDFTAVMLDGGSDPCNSGGCSNAELTYRLEGDDHGEACRSFIKIPSCTVGDSGVRASSWMTAGDQHGRTVRFPLYDTHNACSVPPGTDGTCGNQRYHINDFGCVQVLGSCDLVTPACTAAGYKGGDCNDKVKVVAVQVSCDPQRCASPGGMVCDDTLPGPGSVRAVSLVQ